MVPFVSMCAQAVVTFIDKAMDRRIETDADFKYNPLEEKMRKYDNRDEDMKPRGHLKRRRHEQLAVTEYDLYSI